VKEAANLGGLPIVPFGPGGKSAPTLNFKVGFLSLLILRGLGHGFGYLRFAAILARQALICAHH
jgi:hypothetical protein